MLLSKEKMMPCKPIKSDSFIEQVAKETILNLQPTYFRKHCIQVFDGNGSCFSWFKIETHWPPPYLDVVRFFFRSPSICLNTKQAGGGGVEGGGLIRPQSGSSHCCAETLSIRTLNRCDFYYTLISFHSEYNCSNSLMLPYSTWGGES